MAFYSSYMSEWSSTWKGIVAWIDILLKGTINTPLLCVTSLDWNNLLHLVQLKSSHPSAPLPSTPFSSLIPAVNQTQCLAHAKHIKRMLELSYSPLSQYPDFLNCFYFCHIAQSHLFSFPFLSVGSRFYVHIFMDVGKPLRSKECFFLLRFLRWS